jgi:hypothetical protein
MQRRIIQVLLPTLLASLLPLSAIAVESADQYADSIYDTIHVTDATNVLGSPDGYNGLFHEDNGFVTVDMGEELGEGDLTLYYIPFDSGPSYKITFMDAEFLSLQETSGTLSLDVSSVTIAYVGSDPYRYVKIEATDDDEWGLDAIMSATFPSEDETPTEEPSDEEPPPEEPEANAQGLLVKLVDDGNPDTWTDAAVYVIDADGNRHVFPTERVFLSWWPDYEDLSYIDSVNLSGYTLGKNVTIRPGTNLVKVTTDPKVYAVEPGGVLRWVASEDIAISLYGQDWATRVVDVPDTFFGNYDMGDPIDTKIHPSGTIGVMPDGAVVYIENSVFYRIPGDVFDDMRFQSRYLVTISNDTADLYVDGGYLTDDPSVRWPY